MAAYDVVDGTDNQRSFRMDGGKGIEDDYNFAEDTEKLKKDMFAENDEDDVDQNGSTFLKVYKEEDAQETLEEKRLSKDDVKFKDSNEKEDFEGELKSTSPMIAEIGSKTFDQSD